jgi:hypothetical protein
MPFLLFGYVIFVHDIQYYQDLKNKIRYYTKVRIIRTFPSRKIKYRADQDRRHQETTSMLCNAHSSSNMILCGHANPHGDAYCCYKFNHSHFHEVHQYKHIEDIVNIQMLEAEYKKAACNRDFFVFFTTGEVNVDLNKLRWNIVIVSEENWKEYFGPFWARIFYLKKITPLNINSATTRQMSDLIGFGKTKISQIVAERRKRPFQSIDEAYERLKVSGGGKGIGRELLNKFFYT